MFRWNIPRTRSSRHAQHGDDMELKNSERPHNVFLSLFSKDPRNRSTRKIRRMTLTLSKYTLAHALPDDANFLGSKLSSGPPKHANVLNSVFQLRTYYAHTEDHRDAPHHQPIISDDDHANRKKQHALHHRNETVRVNGTHISKIEMNTELAGSIRYKLWSTRTNRALLSSIRELHNP